MRTITHRLAHFLRLHTTLKGVDNNKIFELRAETRTERSFGCQMMIAKKNRLLSQTGGVAGLETCKKILRPLKKGNNRKNSFKIGWNQKKEVLGYFPNDFLATRGHPLVGYAPLKKITSIHSRQL